MNKLFFPAYGTYKIAKKMSKGLRKEYDDDECWQYNFFTDQYQCTCDEQCNIYVGAAPVSTAASTATVTLMAFFAVAHNCMRLELCSRLLRV